MNKNEVIDLLEQIDYLYPNKLKMDNPQAVINAWHQALKNQKPEVVQENLAYHVENSRFIPTISDLVKKTGGGPVVPNAEETRAMLDRMSQPNPDRATDEEREAAMREIRRTLNMPEDGEKQ